jgi:hypothetical protein
MYSKSNIDNDLGKNEFSVWSQLNSQIDPSQWAKLCRSIGSLNAEEFSMVVELVNAHHSLKNALTGHIKALLGIVGSSDSSDGRVDRHQMPLLSIGPSGVGGEFQKEVSGETGGERKNGSRYSSMFDKIITTLLFKKFFSEV